MKSITFKVRAGYREIRKQTLSQHLRALYSNNNQMLVEQKEVKIAQHLKVFETIIFGYILLHSMNA